MSGREIPGKETSRSPNNRKKKTEDWNMECEDSSASWQVGKFEGRKMGTKFEAEEDIS